MLLKQIFSIPLGDDSFLIYAPLKRTAFIANSALVNDIVKKCGDKGGSPELKNRQNSSSDAVNPDILEELNFFVPEPYPVDDFHTNGIHYDSVVLFLTNECNLRCKYCYASAGEHPVRQMEWETAKAGIDNIFTGIRTNNLRHAALGFHGGGEPSMNLPLLKKSVEYFKNLAAENNISYEIAGAFNGFWNSSVREFIINNFTDLSISFDGLPEIQNLNRPAKGGKGSFTKVSETLKELDKAGFKYGIRLTATDETLHSLYDSVSFICDNYKPYKIQVEPAFDEGRAIVNNSTLSNPDEFIRLFIKSYRTAVEKNIDLFYSGARLNVITQRFCLAACRALVVTPDGDVTTCFESFGKEHPDSDLFFVGRYGGNGKFIIDNDKLKKHYSRTVDNIKFCSDCFCKWHCAGDCAVKNIAVSKGELLKPGSRCYINQELTKFLIMERIAKSGGFIWSEISSL